VNGGVSAVLQHNGGLARLIHSAGPERDFFGGQHLHQGNEQFLAFRELVPTHTDEIRDGKVVVFIEYLVGNLAEVCLPLALIQLVADYFADVIGVESHCEFGRRAWLDDGSNGVDLPGVFVAFFGRTIESRLQPRHL